MEKKPEAIFSHPPSLLLLHIYVLRTSHVPVRMANEKEYLHPCQQCLFINIGGNVHYSESLGSIAGSVFVYLLKHVNCLTGLAKSHIINGIVE